MKQKAVLFAHEELNGNEVMIDYLEDNRRRLKQAVEEMDELCLYWQVALQSNSIATTVWHMGRLMDVFLTQLVQGEPATKKRWFSQGWADRTGYDPRGLGKEGWGTVNGYTAEEVANIPRLSKAQLLNHLDEVYDRVRAFIEVTRMTGGLPGIVYEKNEKNRRRLDFFTARLNHHNWQLYRHPNIHITRQDGSWGNT